MSLKYYISEESRSTYFGEVKLNTKLTNRIINANFAKKSRSLTRDPEVPDEHARIARDYIAKTNNTTVPHHISTFLLLKGGWRLSQETALLSFLNLTD